MADIEGLKEFTRLIERDAAPFFVGRETQLTDIESACADSMEKIRNGAMATSATRVFQGAPGAGKTSLLAEVAVRCGAWKDAPAVLRATCMDLEHPADVILDLAEFVRAGGARDLVRSESRSASAGGSAGLASAIMDSSEHFAAPGVTLTALRRNLPPATWKRPVILAVDEIQNVGPEAKAMLDALHKGAHGLPIIPVYAGLGNSIDVLGDFEIGLSRMAEDHIHGIKALAPEEARDAVRMMLAHYRIREADGTDWPDLLAERSDRWPQHLHNGMRALAQGIVDAGGRLADVDRKQVLARELEWREQAFRRRASNTMNESICLVAAVMRTLDEGTDRRADVVGHILLADRRAPDSPERRKWSLPKGMDARDFLDHMVHRGALQLADDKTYFCPVPSFKTFLVQQAPSCPWRSPRSSCRPDRRGRG